MSPDDPRHDTWAGYLTGCRGDCCRRAARIYQKGRTLDIHRGRPRTVDPTGTVRRIQALGCLGWTGYDIARRLGHGREWLRQVTLSKTIHRTTAERIARVYEALCMTPPPTDTPEQKRNVSRQRKRAAQLGWVPPLGWDDIDNDLHANVQGGYSESSDLIKMDEVVVDRILLHDAAAARTANRAERCEATRRWIADRRPLRQLALLTGWRVERYYDAGSAA